MPASRVRVYAVWEPVLQGEGRIDAQRRAAERRGENIIHLWDPDLLSGRSWRHILGLKGLAWDAYFVYSDTSTWGELPPRPEYWMHQGVGMNVAPFLEREMLIARVREFVERSK